MFSPPVKRSLALLLSAVLAAPGALHADDKVPDITLPSLGTVAGADLSPQSERQLGEEIMAQVRKDKSFLPDQEMTDYLNRLGWRLVVAGPSQPFSFFFFAVRDHTLNAFTLPGGFIGVNTGLIIAAQSESELAGVIGHEIGHVAQRHIARMIASGKDSLAITLGSLLLAIIAAGAGGSSGGNAAMAIALGTQGALAQNQLKFSRDAEREADRIGLQLLGNAGFDPRGMEDFFDRLHKNNRYYESDLTAFLSTHPLSSERVIDMQNRTRNLPRRSYPSQLDFYLIQARARVLQETSYDGWLTLSRELRDQVAASRGSEQIAARYGLGLALARMNQPRDALAELKRAASASSAHSVILDKALAEQALAAAGGEADKDTAVALAKATCERFPDSAMAATSYTDILFQVGRHDEAIKFLRGQNALSRHSADYFGLLARSYQALGQHSLAYAATGDMYAAMGNATAAVYQFDLAQKANDADFYVMSEIDAKLREQRRLVLERKKDKKK